MLWHIREWSCNPAHSNGHRSSLLLTSREYSKIEVVFILKFNKSLGKAAYKEKYKRKCQSCIIYTPYYKNRGIVWSILFSENVQTPCEFLIQHYTPKELHIPSMPHTVAHVSPTTIQIYKVLLPRLIWKNTHDRIGALPTTISLVDVIFVSFSFLLFLE